MPTAMCPRLAIWLLAGAAAQIVESHRLEVEMVGTKTRAVALAAVVAVGAATMLDAQGRRGGGPGAAAAGGPRTGTIEHITVHGKSLEGNLEGDSPDRDVTVYLPPSYAADQA